MIAWVGLFGTLIGAGLFAGGVAFALRYLAGAMLTDDDISLMVQEAITASFEDNDLEEAIDDGEEY